MTHTADEVLAALKSFAADPEVLILSVIKLDGDRYQVSRCLKQNRRWSIEMFDDLPTGIVKMAKKRRRAPSVI